MEAGEIQMESRQESITVLWKIENFSSIGAETGVVVGSPTFETTRPHFLKLKWKLAMSIGKRDETNQDYIGLYLKYNGYCQVSVSYSFSIVNEENAEVIEYTSQEKMFSSKKRSSGTSQFCLKTVISDEATKALANDTLLISCTIDVHNSKLGDERYEEEDRAIAHFEILLETSDFSDVTFEIENNQMRLHKAIVSSVSPVFLAMLQNPMTEKETSVVIITDVKYEVMKQLFRYIYTRRVSGGINLESDLIMAADKYDVKGLKLKCENVVSQSLDDDNALELLEFAITYNTTFLKPVVVEFITSRLEEFVDKPEFEKMDKVSMNVLLRAMAKKKSDWCW